MSVVSLVGAAELEQYMSDMDLSASQRATMVEVLDGIQRELERYCQRQFARVERTETIVPDEMGRLWPKATPVVSVSAPDGMAGFGNQIVGAYTPFGGGWAGGYGGAVEVTYVGGLDPEDAEDVKVAILRVAAREATTRHDDVLDPNDLTARKVEDRDKRPLGWTDDELKKFDRLRRRTVV